MKTHAREFKDKVYEELAKTAKALGNAHRMEIIDLLAQGPLSVEAIANYLGMSVANTSQHLQVLKNARLVEITRKGNFINYHLAGQPVYDAWSAIRELGMAHNAEIKNILGDIRKGHRNVQPVSSEELLQKINAGEVILLDVRPEEEYKRGHIHRAISTPLETLEEKIKKISKKTEIVAYCCGKLCMFADEAINILTQKGYKANRIDGGYTEWVMKGYPVDKADE